MHKDLHEVIEELKDKKQPLLLLLDGLEDPRNLGAILRTAEAVGVDAVILPKKRAAGITDVVRKTSTGAADIVPITWVSNINQAILELKDNGFWIVGIEASGSSAYTKIDYKCRLGLVIGSEGNGLARLTKENCDFVASIPMYGTISSLNASVAAAIVMYEIVRQRRGL
ncbi:MAG: 23S rRNA (guanosine(2251)-2'-O)-methyltransferase RlmB [Candidatus Margulisiibacteriota bacterium]|jgi:23S rRNA (guanosine2251-2'-O)-methyltransferase